MFCLCEESVSDTWVSEQKTVTRCPSVYWTTPSVLEASWVLKGLETTPPFPLTAFTSYSPTQFAWTVIFYFCSNPRMPQRRRRRRMKVNCLVSSVCMNFFHSIIMQTHLTKPSCKKVKYYLVAFKLCNFTWRWSRKDLAKDPAIEVLMHMLAFSSVQVGFGNKQMKFVVNVHHWVVKALCFQLVCPFIWVFISMKYPKNMWPNAYWTDYILELI